MKRILITGAAGRIGIPLLETLSADTEVTHIIAITRRKPVFEHEKVLWLEADLRSIDFPKILEQHRIDTVIHAAWDMRSDDNVSIAERLFRAIAQSTGVQKLIHLSSIVVYGTREVSVLCTEDDPLILGRRGPYGAQKLAVEKALVTELATSERPIDTYILRPVGIYTVLPFLMGLNRYIPFPAPRYIFRQFVHKQDVVDAVAFCVKKPLRGTKEIDIYNLAPPPIPMQRFYTPTWIIKGIFNIIWRTTRYKRASPGKWQLYLYPPLIGSSKGSGLLGGMYRTIPYSEKDSH